MSRKLLEAPSFHPEVERLRGCAQGEEGIARRIETMAAALFIEGDDENAQHLRRAARNARTISTKTLRSAMLRALKYGVPVSHKELKLAAEDVERVGHEAYAEGMREEGADPESLFSQLGQV